MTKIASNKMQNIWISGASGKMGLEIKQVSASFANLEVVGGHDFTFAIAKEYEGKTVTSNLLAEAVHNLHVSTILDFSNAEGNANLLSHVKLAKIKNIAVLVGSTGLTESVIADWKKVAEENALRLLIAPNTSIGVIVSAKLAAEAASTLFPKGFDIEIVETHHNAKVDAPSGTANYYAMQILESIPALKKILNRSGKRDRNEIGMHSIRGGGVFGEHEVRIISGSEEVKISHRAFSRNLFANGALTLSSWLEKQKPGYYRLQDISLNEI